MFIDSPSWNEAMRLIGEAAILLLLFLVAFSLTLVLLTVVSIKMGKFIFPRLLKPGLLMMEGLVRAIWKLLGIDDKELTAFSIRLHNMMMKKRFEAVPPEKRAIFLPQCLRSKECPAHLSDEGLICMKCGRCDIGPNIDEVRADGTKVFIVPGSTFIKRMVKRYRPEAIVGVGCLMEVKEGLEMCDRMGVVAMGFVTLRDGCVETAMDWGDFKDMMTGKITPLKLANLIELPGECKVPEPTMK